MGEFDSWHDADDLGEAGRTGKGDGYGGSCSAASKPYQFVESLLEVLVGHGINDGVDEGVEVTQPGENVK